MIAVPCLMISLPSIPLPLTFLLALLFALPPLSAQDQKSAHIRIAEIDGRSWLVDPQGRPFFAHGVTHVNTKHGVDYKVVAKTCKELGFNAYGYGCPVPLRKDMPYLEGINHVVPVSMYRDKESFQFVDVFDPEVQARMQRQIELLCQRNHKNPNLIGYCWTDLGAWPLDNPTGKNWVDFMRKLPAAAPGKKAYRDFLAAWEGDDAAARDLAFLTRIAREYFRVLGEANRKYDPDHLIFGDRFSFQTFVPEVLKEMLPYVDAIAIQPPYRAVFPKEKYTEIHKLSGKPILLCDFAIRFKDGDKPVRGWKPLANAKLAGTAYTDYLRAAMKTDYIVGAFWCNLVDSKPGFNKTGVKQGLFAEGFAARPDLNAAIRAFNQERDKATPAAITKDP